MKSQLMNICLVLVVAGLIANDVAAGQSQEQFRKLYPIGGWSIRYPSVPFPEEANFYFVFLQDGQRTARFVKWPQTLWPLNQPYTYDIDPNGNFAGPDHRWFTAYTPPNGNQFILVYPVLPSSAAPSESSSSRAALSIPIPPSIAKNEIMSSIYEEYIRQTSAMRKKELQPGNHEGFTCHVYSVDTGKLTETPMSYSTANSGNGRFVRLQLGDPEKDRMQKFLLIDSKIGSWRATEEEETILYYLPHASHSDGPQDSGEVLSKDTVCLSVNEDNPQEFYLELGTRTELSVQDENGQPKVGNFDLYFWGDNEAHEGVVQGNYFDLARDLSAKAHGNVSRPKSHCYRDKDGNPEAYRMTAIGICTQ